MMTETNNKEHRPADIIYIKAEVSCFAGQERGKFKVQFFAES